MLSSMAADSNATRENAPPESPPSAFRRLLDTIARLYGGGTPPVTYVLTRWLFLRLLGVIYLFAFASLWVQIIGLVGSHGISPIADFLNAIHLQYDGEACRLLPTLVWLNSSDSFLLLLCGAGAVLSVLVVVDVLTAPALIALWALYLSLFYAGQDFMAFQWDILLIETGFLAIFFAPWHILPRLSRQSVPSIMVLWLLRLLLFRLMFESGVVKLNSGDPTWRDLTATTYHYFTQPLPTPLAWYAHQLPLPVHKIEVLGTFFVELLVPFLIFLPRRFRLIAAVLIVAQQTIIFLTGNYTFFNLLTTVLCVPLLDDRVLQRVVPQRIAQPMLRDAPLTPSPFPPRKRRERGVIPASDPVSPRSSTNVPILRRVIIVVVAVVILTLNFDQFANLIAPFSSPPFVSSLVNQLDPLHIVSGYGLFATMTTSREEIIIEGSNDGKTWQPYSFKYKPGDPARSPVYVAPYQPRLDWQMWFAALEPGPPQGFLGLVLRLLQGSPDVLALMCDNPCPPPPPPHTRAHLHDHPHTAFAP